MVISEYLLREYFNFNGKNDLISTAFEQLGFFAYKTTGQSSSMISVEIPTSRPDCNSIFGLARELKSLLPDLQLPSFNLSCWEKYDDYGYEFATVTLGSDSIVVTEVMTESLKANRLFTGNKISDFANFQTLMFGNPVVYFNNEYEFKLKILEEDLIYGNEVFYTGTPVIIIDNNYLPWLPLKTEFTSFINNNNDKFTFLTIYFQSIYIKKIIDLYSNIDFNKYYFYIRNSDTEDSLRSVTSIQSGENGRYFRKDTERKIFSLSNENIVNILGINLEQEAINKALQSLNYEITSSRIRPPSYRGDIESAENAISDIMRICFSKITMNNIIKEKDKIALTMYVIDDIITGLTFLGFHEIISSPFVSKKDIDLSYIYKDIENTYLPVKIINKQKNDEIYCPLTFIIGIINKLDNKNNRLFERGQIKYIDKEGRFEVQELICIGEKNNGTLLEFINCIIQIKKYIDKQITIISHHIDNNYSWNLISGDLWIGNIVYIVNKIDNDIIAVFEFAVDIIKEYYKINLINTKYYYMTREISIDIDFSICFLEILDKIYAQDDDKIIEDIRVISANTILKSDVLAINYKLRLIYHDTTKEAIKNINKKIYKELHQQGEILKQANNKYEILKDNNYGE